MADARIGKPRETSSILGASGSKLVETAGDLGQWACNWVVSVAILVAGLSAASGPASTERGGDGQSRLGSGLAPTEGSILAGQTRGPAFQAGRRGFESRLPLQPESSLMYTRARNGGY